MEMDGFVGAVLLIAIGSAAWWALVAWAAWNTFVRVRKQLDPLLESIDQQLGSISKLPPQQRLAYHGRIASMLTQANSQMRQLDSLRRQQYEVRVGELQGMAATAGIDWAPPRY